MNERVQNILKPLFPYPQGNTFEIVGLSLWYAKFVKIYFTYATFFIEKFP